MNLSFESFFEERQIGGEFRRELESFVGADRAALELLITSLRPSANSLRDVLGIVREIAGRDKQSFAEVLAEPDIAAVLAPGSAPAKSLGRKDIKRRLDDLLRRKRYPESTKIEADLERRVRILAKDIGLRVALPEDLEGDAVTVSLSLSSATGALEAGEKLQALANHREFSAVLRILKGLEVEDDR